MARFMCAVALACATLVPLVAQTTHLPTVPPESVGFSSERLTRLTAAMHRLVDDQELAGIVTMVARHGKVVSADAYGYQDLAARTPMPRDAIFRIYSMTKPIDRKSVV